MTILDEQITNQKGLLITPTEVCAFQSELMPVPHSLIPLSDAERDGELWGG